MAFNQKAYQRAYNRTHKKEAQAYNKEYYARPENKAYFLKYRENHREEARVYAKTRRRLIKAGEWTFRDPKKNTKYKNQNYIEGLRERWRVYFDKKAKITENERIARVVKNKSFI